MSDLRRFYGEPSIAAQVESILAGLPEDRKAAAIDVGVDADGIVAVAAVRLGAGWSVMGVMEKRYGGPWAGHAQVRWTGR